MEEARVHAGLQGASDVLQSAPRVTWRPYLISSASRTPVINHGARGKGEGKSGNDVPLLTQVEDGQTTALAVFYGEYPFDSGLYLFPEELDLDYDPILVST